MEKLPQLCLLLLIGLALSSTTNGASIVNKVLKIFNKLICKTVLINWENMQSV